MTTQEIIEVFQIAIDELAGSVNEIQDKHRWIHVSERLPDNAKHKGALCKKYLLMTRHGITEGWYNPDFEAWYVLVWFMTGRYLASEIDMMRGDIPKVVKAIKECGEVIAWMPLPEPFKQVD